MRTGAVAGPRGLLEGCERVTQLAGADQQRLVSSAMRRLCRAGQVFRWQRFVQPLQLSDDGVDNVSGYLPKFGSAEYMQLSEAR